LILLLCLAGSAASTTYTLRWGDTLGKVAARYKVPLPALTAANAGIANPNKVREGTVLSVPDAKAAQVAIAKPIAAVVAPARADGAKSYVVRPGDTLSTIAQHFSTTVAALRTLNAMTKDLIVEGKELQLPASAEVPPADLPLCPVKGATKFDFSNSFGAPRDGQRKHMGNDIFAKRGALVLAPESGTVRPADGGRAGIAFYLDGDGGTTYYGAHLDSRTISSGRVERGQVLGAVGSTGNAAGTPTHVHFEVHPNGGDAVDPYRMLQAWCQ